MRAFSRLLDRLAFTPSRNAKLTLMRVAPPDRLHELKRQRRHDADVDAAAIRAWRSAGGGGAAP